MLSSARSIVCKWKKGHGLPNVPYRKKKSRVLVTKKGTNSLEKCIMYKSKQLQLMGITLYRMQQNNCTIGIEKASK